MNNTPNPFIEAFTIELEKTKNSIFLIENEIKQIETFTSSNDTPSMFSSLAAGMGRYDNSTNSVFDGSTLPSKSIFNKSFFEYNAFGKIDLKSNLFNPEQYKKTVIDFSEYYNWLKELQTTPKKKKVISSLSHKQKMLALHYLGLDVRQYADVKAGNVIAQILDLDSHNTRTNLPSVYFNSKDNKVRTKQNLERLLTLFEDNDFEEIKAQITTDLQSIK
ncbi:hypothetical protein [Winogradskyella ludwigii]|uniref:hypothetical protein n=1 Tax=Winogradskyella ludwigii TaxID=2686076 RepID=UPI0015CBCC10|nr:hypothetical protein [Winogradskyella ludwigii]